MKNVLIIAAENSAENYGSQIIDQFLTQKEEIHFFGIGGDKFAERGVEINIHNRELAIVGIVEIVSKLFKLIKIQKLLLKKATQKKADAALLIDYPDFNLRLAKKLKKRGIPVYYYISPTVWAWRYSRVKTIKKFIEHLFIIFPFEVPIYQKEQIPFTYTGHPLIPMIKVSEDRKTFRQRWHIAENSLMITLLPGSRRSEVLHLLPEMLKAMELLNGKFKSHIFILKADSIDASLIERIKRPFPLDIRILPQSKGHNGIHASDVVISTCGTSNLEIVILGVPFIAIYKINNLTYAMGKRFVKIRLYSIVNILAGKQVIPELIQHECQAERIVSEIEAILNSPRIQNNMLAEFFSGSG